MTDLATMLGHAPATRVLIPHLDDVAVGHGANRAFVDLAGRGFVTTGSVMVPCPWFPEIVALAKEQPELDLGVHLTLTSEARAAAGGRSPPSRAPPACSTTTATCGPTSRR